MRSRCSTLRVCLRGFYSCYWKHSRERNRCGCCWFSFLCLMSILTLGWIYICFVAYNDNSDVNWKAFKHLGVWFNWYMSAVILSAVLAIYCLLLVVFSFVLLAMKEPLHLHCIHKHAEHWLKILWFPVFLIVGLVIVILGTAGMSFAWKEEWNTVIMSLQATAVFLQLAAVVALSMISWFVFQSYHLVERAVSRILILGALFAVSLFIFISPLMIYSPCITDKLPMKPALVAHRGAPLLAPENTMMSFNKSVECNVAAFETDVQLSKDRVPFLMHDSKENFLRRTTNVDVIFPNRIYNTSKDFTRNETKELNAGAWFLKTDPFWSVSLLSDEQKTLAQKQKIPSLCDLLKFAKDHNTSLIFDLKNDDDECNETMTTIMESGISQDLIWWLPSRCREYVREHAPGFRHAYENVSVIESTDRDILNVKYNAQSTTEIRNWRSKNITVNLWVVNERWLFSLLWCSGASSVTTNTCHLFKDMSKPDWHLLPHQYRSIWITADLLSLLVMIILFFLQRRRQARNRISNWNQQTTVPLL